MLQGVVGIAGIIHRNKKKVFFLFLPSHPHKCGSSALFIGGSSVRAQESILSGFLFTEFNKSTRKVQLSGTDSSA